MAVSPEEQRRLADALTRALSDQQTAQELLNQANATGIDLEKSLSLNRLLLMQHRLNMSQLMPQVPQVSMFWRSSKQGHRR